MEDGKEFQQKIPAEMEAKQVVARYSYEANQPEDLAFQKGDIILVLSKGKQIPSKALIISHTYKAYMDGFPQAFSSLQARLSFFTKIVLVTMPNESNSATYRGSRNIQIYK